MSYRDLRNFSESMRTLGFSSPISVESFREPNWAMLEPVLRWLAARAQPGATLPAGAADPSARLAVITRAVALFHSSLNLKLNGRKLYGADGWAVKELLKVTAVLEAARAAPAAAAAEAGAGDASTLHYDVTSKLGEIKQARRLATEITARGAFLYELLAKEPEHATTRARALARPLDLASLETSLRLALTALSSRSEAARADIAGVAAREASLDTKLERRRAELERAEKRLRDVHRIKPAYQGELSALTATLSELWTQFVARFRCVEALKHQLATIDTAHAEAAAEQRAAVLQLIHKYEAEDVLGKLSDEEELESSASSEGVGSAARPAARPRTRLRITSAAHTGNADSRATFGAMAGDDSDSDTENYARPAAVSSGSSRWRPATRALLADDDFADLVEGVEGVESVGSSSESELQQSRAPSDNEF